MNKLIAFFISCSFFANAQRTCSHARTSLKSSNSAASALSHEMKYDLKFVHLNLNVERTNKTISGNVKTIATVTASSLDTFMTLLHQNYTIDSIRFNTVLVAPVRQDSMIKAKVPVTLTSNSTFTSIVYYHGTAPTGGAAIGSGLSNASSPSWGNQVTWSLSESFVAYHWWPCKQVLTDKIDSSWVFVTTDSTNMAGSNGLLKNVVTIGNKKRYEWKSSYPIDYYLISIAVAKYKEYRLYAKPQYLNGDSILIQNYIYDNALASTNFNNQKTQLNQMPQVLSKLSDLYGMYPFKREKYGHCMAPLSGGMEHQTMTTVGFFDYYVDAHELGHQWWGDNVTCKSWGDIWINEGFAVYSEFLTAQYLDPTNFATVVNDAHTSVMSQPGGKVAVEGTDTLNTNRIFSSRLTYDKGGSIIHTLRFVTNNDSLWFNILRGFQNTYKNGTAGAKEFKAYYEAQTGTNATQFFDQWYYGEGYPTFNVKYNNFNNQVVMTVSQTVSAPTTSLFITPLEYKFTRMGKPDTTVRLLHTQPVENYTIPVTGTVSSVIVDPNNWVINKVIGPTKDVTMGIMQNTSEDVHMQLTPNPTSDKVSVTCVAIQGGTYTVYDVSGKLVLTGSFDLSKEIELSHLPAATYILQLNGNDGKQISTRILKK